MFLVRRTLEHPPRPRRVGALLRAPLFLVDRQKAWRSSALQRHTPSADVTGYVQGSQQLDQAIPSVVPANQRRSKTLLSNMRQADGMHDPGLPIAAPASLTPSRRHRAACRRVLFAATSILVVFSVAGCATFKPLPLGNGRGAASVAALKAPTADHAGAGAARSPLRSLRRTGRHRSGDAGGGQ